MSTAQAGMRMWGPCCPQTARQHVLGRFSSGFWVSFGPVKSASISRTIQLAPSPAPEGISVGGLFNSGAAGFAVNRAALRLLADRWRANLRGIGSRRRRGYDTDRPTTPSAGDFGLSGRHGRRPARRDLAAVPEALGRAAVCCVEIKAFRRFSLLLIVKRASR